jgi:hypothetical protein
MRIGFEATARTNRHDFGVSWQDQLPGGGVVVGNEIELALDADAILLDELERTGAIQYRRAQPTTHAVRMRSQALSRSSQQPLQ